MGTKRLARKMLDRFARIFFNCLAEDWDLDFDNLKHVCGDGVFMDGTKKSSSCENEDDDDGAETEEEEDGDGGPGVNEDEDAPHAPVGSYDLWMNGNLGGTLTTLAQNDWLIQHMPDDGDGWAGNAMLMLQYLGLPEYADQHLAASVGERKHY